jgi:glutamine amidotransferase
MITIVDYGMSNLGSVQNMFKKVGVPCRIARGSDQIASAQALVLPGVGHFDRAIRTLHELNLKSALDTAVLVRRVPILGICLGMQLMTRASEEGELPGLGWVAGDTRRIVGARAGLRVPHMGWNSARVCNPSVLFDPKDNEEQRFYFVHTYAVHCDDVADVLATTTYGDDFVSAFAHANMVGVQFHPEKSHKFGMNLLRRFAAWALSEQKPLTALASDRT